MAKKGSWTDSKEQTFDNPFAALKKGGPATPPPDEAPSPPTPSTEDKTPKRAVVRLEKKGRGGKTATIISHLGLEPDALARWAKALRTELGCGGTVEGDTIALQGDQRARAKDALTKKGIRKITVS